MTEYEPAVRPAAVADVPPEGLHEYVYGDVPPEAVTVPLPLLPPLQLAFTVEEMVEVKLAG